MKGRRNDLDPVFFNNMLRQIAAEITDDPVVVHDGSLSFPLELIPPSERRPTEDKAFLLGVFYKSKNITNEKTKKGQNFLFFYFFI